MNRQEIYDTVAKHLLTQGVQSILVLNGGFKQCRYRGPNNTKCAIGCLISDEEYSESFEGVIITSLIEYSDVSLSFLKDRSQEDIRFLGALQDIHDQAEPKDWQTELRRFAMINNLVPYVHSI